MKSAIERRLPAIHWARYHVGRGGLISFGANIIDLHRQSASYVDRILKGEKASELPVQGPIKIELVINLKTKALISRYPPCCFRRLTR